MKVVPLKPSKRQSILSSIQALKKGKDKLEVDASDLECAEGDPKAIQKAAQSLRVAINQQFGAGKFKLRAARPGVYEVLHTTDA